MNNKIIFITILLLLLIGCSGKYSPPVLLSPFGDVPAPPDYSVASSWASLPELIDPADRVPESSGLKDMQASASADVFFIHPTSYLKHTELSVGWNADVSDDQINNKTDEGSILNQASIFNGAGKVYAPRYRQAFIYSYFTSEKDKANRSFDTAYADVKNAFEYYLRNFNQGRPFIVASHSQGTTHAIRLLQEYLDNEDALSEKLVAAYLVGMDVYDTLFTVLQPCKNENETNCYITWRTYAQDYFPENYVQPNRETVCTNPLTWKLDHILAPRELNLGGVLRKFDKVIPELSDAQVLDGVLRINEPHFTGRMFFNFKNYHIVDYNLFYLNVRHNAIHRVRMFRDANPSRMMKR